MIRSDAARVEAVWGVVHAARQVTAARYRITDALIRTTGLSREGVALGFDRHLETRPSESEIARLVACTPEAPEVHVVLSSNVFTAPLRALAVARAAAPRVIVRPSRWDPVFTDALVDALQDASTQRVQTLSPEEVLRGEVHIYGRDETIAYFREQVPPSVVIRGHGTGLGVAIVFASDEGAAAADALAQDVIAFDQRGCMSPRIVWVEGGLQDAEAFATELSDALARRGADGPPRYADDA